MSSDVLILLLFVLLMSIFLGLEIISKVPSKLHTPLMSASNAISGITIIGAVASAGYMINDTISIILGVCSVIFATINVVGGYVVSDRMLAMFKKKVTGKPLG